MGIVQTIRVDDRLDTVLALADSSAPPARAAAFLQLVDMLADDAFAHMPPERGWKALARIARLARCVSEETRRTAMAALLGRRANFAIIALFGHEPIVHLGPLLRSALMDPEEWQQLIPALPPAARALLCERFDLPLAARLALKVMAPHCALLPAPPQILAAPVARAETPQEPAPTPAPASTPAPEAVENIPSPPLLHIVPPEPLPRPEPAPAAEAFPFLRQAPPVPLAPLTAKPVQTSAMPNFGMSDLAPVAAGLDELAPLATDMGLREFLPTIEEVQRRISALLVRAGHSPVAVAAPPAPVAEPLPASPAALVAWTWESDAQGRIMGASGEGRALIGHRLADITQDAALHQAMLRHVPFRNQAVVVAILDPHRPWALSAIPNFDLRNGEFQGFRGTARRLSVEEEQRAQAHQRVPSGLFGTGVSFEKLSAMAHEVRTPLNAIMGFAQLIDVQALGPASETYRHSAQLILNQSDRLLDALDDLIDATRLVRGRMQLHAEEIDVGRLVRDIGRRYASYAHRRGSLLDVLMAPGLPHAWTDPALLERALGRLLTAVLATGGQGECIWLSLRAGARDNLTITLSRPHALADWPADQLLRPDQAPREGVDPPLLGLGFSLRLVRQLCGLMGGELVLEPHQFRIAIPALAAAAKAS